MAAGQRRHLPHVEPGEVYGLLGPNGAGKTTLVKQAIGFSSRTSGASPSDRTISLRIPASPASCAPTFSRPTSCRSTPSTAGRIVRRAHPGGAAAPRRRRAHHRPRHRRMARAAASGGALGERRWASPWRTRSAVVILDQPRTTWTPCDVVLGGAAPRLGRWFSLRRHVSRPAPVDRLWAIARAGRLPKHLHEGRQRGDCASAHALVPGRNTLPRWIVCCSTLVATTGPPAIDEVTPPMRIGRRRLEAVRDTAEEYALGATSLEDAYIRLTGQSSPSEKSV